MKKILLLFLAISIFACNNQKENKDDFIVFSGKITNPVAGELSISGDKGIIKKIKVDETGCFSDTLKGISEGFYSFHYGREFSSFYLRPGFNLFLELNPKEFDESIVYKGKGEEINNYLAKEMLRNENIDKSFSYQVQAKLNEEEYVRKMDSLKQLSLKNLNDQRGLDNDFKDLQTKIINYNWASKILMFEPLKRYFTKDPSFTVSKDYPDPTKNIDLEDESMLGIPEFDAILNTYYRKLTQDKIKNNKDAHFYKVYLNVLNDNIKSQKIKNKLMYDLVNDNISYVNDIEDFYQTYMKYQTNKEYQKSITKKYDKLKNLAKGKPSPKFNKYENYKGGETSLDDFKGKFVYIDVWATWCGPCKGEIPFLKKITNAYKGKNIVFISMSIDKKKDHKKWKEMVKKENLQGVQIFAPNDWKSDFVTQYGIQGIPRFILIDPDGNIVSANAPRPSDPNLKALFTSLNI